METFDERSINWKWSVENNKIIEPPDKSKLVNYLNQKVRLTNKIPRWELKNYKVDLICDEFEHYTINDNNKDKLKDREEGEEKEIM